MTRNAAIGWQGWSRHFGTIGNKTPGPSPSTPRAPKKVIRRALPEAGESRRGHGDLWATKTGELLHATEDCCLGVFPMPVHRKQVKDFPNPRHFDGDRFRLCKQALDTAEMPERAA